MLKILGVIPSRFASTRFPGKPLADIHGKSMIQRVYEQVLQVSAFSKVIVATDDLRIVDHVEAFGGNVLMTAQTHLSGTDRCGEVVHTLTEEFDIVVNIQGDEPFIQPAQLENIISIFSNPDIQIATLAIKIHQAEDLEDPNIVKVVSGNTSKALYFSRAAIPFNRNKDVATVHYKHIGIYAYRTDILEQIIALPPGILEKAESLEQLRWLAAGFTIHVAETDIETISIDTPQDLEKLRSPLF